MLLSGINPKNCSLTLDYTVLSSRADAALQVQVLELFQNAGGRFSAQTVSHIRGHAGHVAVGHVAKAFVVTLRYEIDEGLRVDGQTLKHLTRIVCDWTPAVYAPYDHKHCDRQYQTDSTVCRAHFRFYYLFESF